MARRTLYALGSLCLGALLVVTSSTLLAANRENTGGSVRVIGRSGIAVPRLPAGMQLVLDTPRMLLVSGEETACGWRSGSDWPIPLTDVQRHDDAIAKRLIEHIRALSGVASATLISTRLAPDKKSLIAEFAADAISEKGTYSRRLLLSIARQRGGNLALSGFCISPATKYPVNREWMARVASSAVLTSLATPR